MSALMIVEDDEDIRSLIRMLFKREPQFAVVCQVESAEEGIEFAKSAEIGLIVLDHGLTGELTGLAAAPLLKAVAPEAKIILFTADPGLRNQAATEAAIDGFLVKTEFSQLVPTALRVCNLQPLAV